MDKNALYPYGVGIFIVCWTIACSLLSQSSYYRQEELILTRISSILREAVKIEQKSQLKVYNKYYYLKLSSNKISIKEKKPFSLLPYGGAHYPIHRGIAIKLNKLDVNEVVFVIR